MFKCSLQHIKKNFQYAACFPSEGEKKDEKDAFRNNIGKL